MKKLIPLLILSLIFTQNHPAFAKNKPKDTQTYNGASKWIPGTFYHVGTNNNNKVHIFKCVKSTNPYCLILCYTNGPFPIDDEFSALQLHVENPETDFNNFENVDYPSHLNGVFTQNPNSVYISTDNVSFFKTEKIDLYSNSCDILLQVTISGEELIDWFLMGIPNE